MDILELTVQDWPSTVYAWYGDSNFAATLLGELGWKIRSETPITGLSEIEQLFENISDTIPFTEHYDQLIVRSVNRWNMLIWRNDDGGALSHLADLPLAMPVYEFTTSNQGKNLSVTVGLGTVRCSLESTDGVVGLESITSLNPSLSERDYLVIEEDGKPVGIDWTMRLINSIGLPTNKTLRVHSDIYKTLTGVGATRRLFDVDDEVTGKLAVLAIDDVDE